MFIWMKKGYAHTEGEIAFTFDPPEESEQDDWIMLTTRDRHYKDIAKEVEKIAVTYEKSGDISAAKVANALSQKLRTMHQVPTTVN